MNRQIDEVCDQLGGIEELKEGFNAIGLSQVNWIHDNDCLHMYITIYFLLLLRVDNSLEPMLNDATLQKF